MLKRISVQDLTLGMYLHEFCGSWMDHPFWRAKFLLKDPEDLVRIHDTTIRELWIDTSRGCDVPAGVDVVSPEEVEAQVEKTFSSIEETAPVPLPIPAVRTRDQTAAPVQEELHRAVAICARAKTAVVSMFNEARMGNAVDTIEVQNLVEDISDSVQRNPGALISLARLKQVDDYSYMHSVAVCALMVALARQLKLSDEQTRVAGMAGLMHDLGKAVIPLSVLNKPGKLTDEEFAVVRNHPLRGYEMLKAGGVVDEAVMDACLHHHEKIDGSGYPHRLQANQLSLLARMTAVCDVYDAITSNRPYKNGWDPAESLRQMAQWTGHFDTPIFHAFVKSLGIYPIGSLVRLDTGDIGVVIDQHTDHLTTPIVKTFFSSKTAKRFTPVVVDLAAPGCKSKIAAREDPAHWNFKDLDELWMGMADVQR